MQIPVSIAIVIILISCIQLGKLAYYEIINNPYVNADNKFAINYLMAMVGLSIFTFG